MKSLVLLLLLVSATGCSRSYQRFVDAGGPALDTKTGQLCNPGPQKTNALPLCYDLYKHE